jgi:hypothetical protein
VAIAVVSCLLVVVVFLGTQVLGIQPLGIPQGSPIGLDALLTGELSSRVAIAVIERFGTRFLDVIHDTQHRTSTDAPHPGSAAARGEHPGASVRTTETPNGRHASNTRSPRVSSGAHGE